MPPTRRVPINICGSYRQRSTIYRNHHRMKLGHVVVSRWRPRVSPSLQGPVCRPSVTTAALRAITHPGCARCSYTATTRLTGASLRSSWPTYHLKRVETRRSIHAGTPPSVPDHGRSLNLSGSHYCDKTPHRAPTGQAAEERRPPKNRGH